MTEQLKNDFKEALITELDFQHRIPRFIVKMSENRTFSYNSFYPLAGCAAHLRASITEITQLHKPYKNLSGRDCVNLSLASYIYGEMT